MRQTVPQTPSLFPDPVHVVEPPVTEPEETKAEDIPKRFVRWCFGFGADFRNSPDEANLRFWAKKHRIKIKPSDEPAILEAARELYLKKMESLLPKSDSAG